MTTGLRATSQARLAAGLGEVRGLLARSLDRLAELDLMTSPHPVGGKLLRPRLLLLMTVEQEPPRPGAPALAAAVELIHLASLYHDDVLDSSPRRRQEASVRELFGNKVSILYGDAILTAALDLLLGVSTRRMQRAVAHAVRETLRGEIAQHTGHRSFEVTGTDCIRVAARKTGSLFGLAARLGGLAAGDPPEVTRLAYRLGRRLGTAYQLIDDGMDYFGSAEALGKEPGTDYRDGIATLPLISAWRAASPEERRVLEAGFGGNGSADIPAVRRIMIAARMPERSFAAARGQLDAARAMLPELPGPERAELLAEYCDDLEERIVSYAGP